MENTRKYPSAEQSRLRPVGGASENGGPLIAAAPSRFHPLWHRTRSVIKKILIIQINWGEERTAAGGSMAATEE